MNGLHTLNTAEIHHKTTNVAVHVYDWNYTVAYPATFGCVG